MRITNAIVLWVCLGSFLPEARAGLTFDVAADYSRTNNPNGVWSYGFETSLNAPFILFNDTGVREGVDTWRSNIASDGNPAVYHNATASTIVIGGTARFDPGQFGLHPGPGGQYAVVRWTAPVAGSFTLTSLFTGLDTFGATTDVHVSYNGQTLFDGLIEPAGNSAQFSRNFTVAQGDRVDFAVGFGRNGNFSDDSTGLAATFTQAVPEPSSFVMIAVGVLGPGICRWRHTTFRVQPTRRLVA